MNIKTIFADLVAKLLPTRTIIVNNERYAAPEIASSLSVDRLLSTLRSADGGDLSDLFAIYRDMMSDTHLQNAVNTRKLGVMKDQPYFQAMDSSSEAEAVKRLVAAAWKELPGKRQAITHLLDSALYPVSLVEKIYAPSEVPGLRWGVSALNAVPYHLLNFQEGRLRLQRVDEKGLPLSVWDELDATRFITHRGHLLTSFPDKWGGPMRAALFWWLFKTQDRSWWVEFLARFGVPFTVGKYPDGREDSRRLLQRAFGQMQRLFGLVVSQGTDVEVHSVQTSAHGEAFQNFSEFANKELSKLVLGQTMTTEAQGTGMNSNQAEVHERGADDIREFDAEALAETLREQLFQPLLRLNGLPDRLAPSISWGSEDPVSMRETVSALEALPKAGLQPADSALPIISRRLSFDVMRASPVAVPATFSATLPTGKEILAREGAATLPPIFREYHAALLRAGGDPAKTAEVLAGIPYAARAAVLNETLVAFAASA